MTKLFLVFGVIMFLIIPGTVVAREPPEPPPPPPPPPQIDMDVLIVYDDTALLWYEIMMLTSDEEAIKEGMVGDILKLNDFFHQYWDNIDWYADTDWMVYDDDGYSGSFSNGSDYYWGWQEELGWPAQPDPWWGWNHIGMPGDGYSNLHGQHFDYLVMIGAYPNLEAFAGMNYHYHNAAWLNVAGIYNRDWTVWGLFALEGIWTVLCHEVGHGYGLSHGDSDDIMDVDLFTGAQGKYLPGSKILSATSKALIYPVLNAHCEKFWYLDSGFTKRTSPYGRAVNGYSVTVGLMKGYHVDTSGCTGGYYDFFAYGSQMYYADENGAISGSGYFKMYDTLPPTAYNHRYVKVYILDTSFVIQASAYILTSSNSLNYWIKKSFTVSDLIQGGWYYVAFGRFDAYSGDYHFTAEWIDVAIYNRAN